MPPKPTHNPAQSSKDNKPSDQQSRDKQVKPGSTKDMTPRGATSSGMHEQDTNRTEPGKPEKKLEESSKALTLPINRIVNMLEALGFGEKTQLVSPTFLDLSSATTNYCNSINEFLQEVTQDITKNHRKEDDIVARVTPITKTHVDRILRLLCVLFRSYEKFYVQDTRLDSRQQPSCTHASEMLRRVGANSALQDLTNEPLFTRIERGMLRAQLRPERRNVHDVKLSARNRMVRYLWEDGNYFKGSV